MLLKQKIILFIFLLAGIFIQVIPVIRSGIKYDQGIGFWGPMAHDGVWHLSLINHISNPLNINIPIFTGEKLVNYHPFFDIFISFLSRFTNISSSIWLFQIFPLISSFFLLYLSYYLGRLLTGKFSTGLILLSLNAIANSFGWLVTLTRSGNLSGESIFWAMQSPSNQINPPYNLSLIFILFLLIIILRHLSQPKLNTIETISIILILILLPITKAYSGLVGFSLFGLFALKSLLKYNVFSNFIIIIVSFVLSLSLFTHYNPLTTSLFVYKPLWFINSMIDSPDRLYIPVLSNARFILELTNKFEPRLIIIYLVSFLIFIIGNYSWRLIGFYTIFKKLTYFKKMLLINIIFLTTIPLLFIQKGTSWNTIQFLYYALFLSNILFAMTFPLKLKILSGIIFITFFLGFIGKIPEYLIHPPSAYISNQELTALNFLKNQPPGTVLTYPYDNYLKNKYLSSPIPLYAYDTTSYVSAYSYHPTYLEDEINLNNSGYNFELRRKQVQEFFLQKHITESRGFLVNNQIDYIYLTGLQTPISSKLNLQELSLQKIFENSDSIIYKVQR